ncbi:MAG: thermonuclease family protein [Pseudolabrys sp.]|nr:thermonuclease family protein [Pseudolabrys sp.]MDP2296758.1 thermonuclease family protein [Pseudolabrys sp.]
MTSLGVGAANSAPCALPGTSSGTVSAVRDGRTLQLADGRDVRLAFIEGADRGAGALRTLVDGRTLRLDHASPGTDRYGRLVAFATLPGAAQSVQETLLAQGEALVSARIGSKTCAEALLAAERAARTAGRGRWADPNFAPLSSENLPGLDAARGRFALVEGRVLSVRESGATIYMNFGRRWTRDFTVTLLKRRQGTFAAAGLDVKELEGRRVRVRGWIERRGGPIIDAAAPEQIELVD